jgi:hypothetical protein
MTLERLLRLRWRLLVLLCGALFPLLLWRVVLTPWQVERQEARLACEQLQRQADSASLPAEVALLQQELAAAQALRQTLVRQPALPLDPPAMRAVAERAALSVVDLRQGVSLQLQVRGEAGWGSLLDLLEQLRRDHAGHRLVRLDLRSSTRGSVARLSTDLMLLPSGVLAGLDADTQTPWTGLARDWAGRAQGKWGAEYEASAHAGGDAVEVGAVRDPFAWGVAMVAANFDKGKGKSVAVGKSAAPAGPASLSGRWRLRGTVGGRSAQLEGPEGQTRVLVLGDSLAGWTLQAVGIDSVRLVWGASSQVMRLR